MEQCQARSGSSSGSDIISCLLWLIKQYKYTDTQVLMSSYCVHVSLLTRKMMRLLIVITMLMMSEKNMNLMTGRKQMRELCLWWQLECETTCAGAGWWWWQGTMFSLWSSVEFLSSHCQHSHNTHKSTLEQHTTVIQEKYKNIKWVKVQINLNWEGNVRVTHRKFSWLQSWCQCWVVRCYDMWSDGIDLFVADCIAEGCMRAAIQCINLISSSTCCCSTENWVIHGVPAHT